MYALESAMDELAVALDLDPVELRIRNDAGAEPDSGLRFSSRHLAECLRKGASLFGWTRATRGQACGGAGRGWQGQG